MVFGTYQSSAQNVGIGTNVPISKLSVNGGLSVGTTYATGTTAAPTNGAAIQGTVGIGTTNPDASAILDLTATNKGLSLPNVALTSATNNTLIVSPKPGLLVYNTGTGGLTPAGIYANSGTAAAPNWVKIVDGAAITGTPNYTAKFTGINTIGNSLIYDNGTNVSIGLAGAGTLKLDVIGSIGLKSTTAVWDHLYLSHDGGTARVRAGGAENGLAFDVSGANAGDYGAQTYVTGMTLLPVLTSGVTTSVRVGIGTASPGDALHVSAAEGPFAPGLGVFISGGASGNAKMEMRGGSPYIDFANNASTTDYDMRLIMSSNTNLQLFGGTLDMTSHKIISVTDPTNAQDVATKNYVDGKASTTATTIVNTAVAGTTGYITKFTGNNAVGNSGMYETGGNIGIGTTNPVNKLQVEGNLHMDGNPIYFRAGGGADKYDLVKWNSTTDRIDIGGYNGTSLGYTSAAGGTGNITPVLNVIGGAVAINNVVPYSTLDVSGNIYTTIHGSTNEHDVSNRGTTRIGMKIGNDASDGFAGMELVTYAGPGCGNGGIIKFNTWACNVAGSREVMRIDEYGNLFWNYNSSNVSIALLPPSFCVVIPYNGGCPSGWTQKTVGWDTADAGNSDFGKDNTIANDYGHSSSLQMRFCCRGTGFGSNN